MLGCVCERLCEREWARRRLCEREPWLRREPEPEPEREREREREREPLVLRRRRCRLELCPELWCCRCTGGATREASEFRAAEFPLLYRWGVDYRRRLLGSGV